MYCTAMDVLIVGGLLSINAQQIVMDMDRKHMRNGPFAPK